MEGLCLRGRLCRKESSACTVEATHGEALAGVAVEHLQDRGSEGAQAFPGLGAEVALPWQGQVPA